MCWCVSFYSLVLKKQKLFLMGEGVLTSLVMMKFHSEMYDFLRYIKFGSPLLFPLLFRQSGARSPFIRAKSFAFPVHFAIRGDRL